MASNASQAAVSRYRPAVLAITGLAAAYGTYLVYTSIIGSDRSIAPRKARTLHRSNAVHRSRRRRRHSVVITAIPSRDGNDIQLRCYHGEHVYVHQMWGSPNRQEVLESLQLTAEEVDDVILSIELNALDSLFHRLDQRGVSSFPDDTAQDLAPLVIAIRHRNEADMKEYAHLLTDRYWKYSDDAVQEEAAIWCARSSIESIDDVQIEDLDDPLPTNDEAETLADDSDINDNKEPDQGIKALLYHIAEDEAKRQAYIHRGTRCDCCNVYPIRGIRWHCLNCPDYDLCTACERKEDVHLRTHVFAKIRIPITSLSQPHEVQEPWYPGNLHQRVERLSSSVRKSLALATTFDETQIEAYWEQFSCMVSHTLAGDPIGVNAGIDRFTFENSMRSKTALHPVEPNFLYERMFQFYDTNRDGLIDFREFVEGIDYLLNPAKRCSLRRVLQGYDADNDGLVSRRDFLRMFRAKYAIHKTMMLDGVAVEQIEPRAHGRDAADIVRSSQPLSAGFTDADVPMGGTRRSYSKPIDEFGDHQITGHPLFSQAILPDGEREMDEPFWTAVLERYGKPSQLKDLHVDFNRNLDGHLETRPHYIGAEALPIDNNDGTNESRYLVRTDTRTARPYKLSREGLEEEWRADLSDALDRSKRSDHDSDDQKTDEVAFDDVVGKGLSYEVPASQLAVGHEALFQVIEEGLNELLDPLFADKERMVAAINATRSERLSKRNEIFDDFEKRRLQEEGRKDAMTDPLLAVANSSISNSNMYDQDDNWLVRQLRQSAFEEAIERVTPRNVGTPLPVPPTTTLDISPTRREDRPAVDSAEISREVSVHIGQQDMIPTDESSLNNMEATIREQALEDLLQAAGYSVAEAVESESSQDNRSGVDVTETHAPIGGDTGIPSDPTMPQSRPSAAMDAMEASQEQMVQPSASRPATPSATRGMSDTAHAGDGGMYRTPARQTNGTFVGPSDDAQSGNGAAGPARSQITEEQRSSSAEQPPGSDSEDLTWRTWRTWTDSSERLPYLMSLNYEELMIKDRGGPGRLTLDELEKLIWRDQHEGDGKLKGLIESWLEFAIF